MSEKEDYCIAAIQRFLEDYELLCKRHAGIRLYVRGNQMAVGNDMETTNEDLIKPVFATYTYEEINHYNLIGDKWEIDDE